MWQLLNIFIVSVFVHLLLKYMKPGTLTSREAHLPFSSFWISLIIGFSRGPTVSSSLTCKSTSQISVSQSCDGLKSSDEMLLRGQMSLTTLMRLEGSLSSSWFRTSNECLENKEKMTWMRFTEKSDLVHVFQYLSLEWSSFHDVLSGLAWELVPPAVYVHQPMTSYDWT